MAHERPTGMTGGNLGKIRFDRGEYIDRSEIEVIDLDLGRYGEQQREPSIAGD